MRHVLAQTLAQLSRACRPAPNAPRHVRHAVERLDSASQTVRREAETVIYQHLASALPVLRQTACDSAAAPCRRVRAAVLLSRLHEPDGSDLLLRLAREPRLRTGPYRDLLRQALHDHVGAERYLTQARIALARLEQFPESVVAIIRFRHALEMLRFLHTPLPADLLARALVVRQVGGENLSLVRQALAPEPDHLIEHVCIARQQAVLTLLHFTAPDEAFRLLACNFAHPVAAVKITALYGLGVLGDVRAVPLVTPLALDDGSEVQDDARALLLALRGQSGDAVTLLRGSGFHDDTHTLLRPTLSCASRDAQELARPTMKETR